jgi:hypothetical protein
MTHILNGKTANGSEVKADTTHSIISGLKAQRKNPMRDRERAV